MLTLAKTSPHMLSPDVLRTLASPATQAAAAALGLAIPSPQLTPGGSLATLGQHSLSSLPAAPSASEAPRAGSDADGGSTRPSKVQRTAE
jgi:hypothetical protein